MSFLFRHRDPGSRHVYRYGPLRITCVDRDVPIDARVNAHLMYKVVLSWEDKARCATPFDMIARKAVDMILDARAGSVADHYLILPTRLVVRESTTAPKKS